MRTKATVAYEQLPGLYNCGDFGLPDAKYNRLRITPEFLLVSVSADGAEFLVGRLSRKGPGAEVEYSMELVHAPTFNLDPYTAARIWGTEDTLEFVAKQGEAQISKTCGKSG